MFEVVKALSSPLCHSRGLRALRWKAAPLAAWALALFLTSLPVDDARADLRVCNKTSSRVSTAIGYRDTEGWVTEGWWTLQPVTCETILSGPLGARFYYIYALDADQGGWWSGESFMCTQHRMFKIRGIDKCGDRGYERTGFLEIDTGEQRSWTVQLTEPSQP